MSKLKDEVLKLMLDGWCDGCESNVTDCLVAGKCAGRKELDNVSTLQEFKEKSIEQQKND